MPRILRRGLFWAALAYAVSLPLSFIAGGALFARPVKEPVTLQSLCDAMDPSWDRAFLQSLQQVEIPIRPRTRLMATVFGGSSSSTVIVLHASRGNRVSELAAAYALWEAGHDVVLLDRRAHGSSDGEVLPLFGGEEPDLSAVLDRVIAERWTGTARIGLFGVGDGGTSCLIAAAGDARVDAVVAEAPALTAGDFIATKLRSWLPVPEPLLFAQTFLAVRGLCLIGGVDAQELDASAPLRGLRIPVLLLENPEIASARQTREVLDAIGGSQCDLERACEKSARRSAMVAFFDRHL
ncbi:MAG: hypothetical protein HY812_04660 [Planctomycetes bacterium]|nr:hypothetical protein [Planctomycetota bacterium]